MSNKNIMGDKGHFWISISKSALRIGGCILALSINSITILAGCFLAAEILGIAEEFADKRK